MKPLLPAILLIGLIVGCGDERPVKTPNGPNAHQAEHNQRDAELQKLLAEGSKRLIEADAQSRDKFLAMQDHLRADQAALEADRREIAAQRNRDPIVAASIERVGLWLACLMPLVLAGYLVWAMRHTASQDDAIVAEFLVADAVAKHPLLLGPPPEPGLLQLSQTANTEPTFPTFEGAP